MVFFVNFQDSLTSFDVFFKYFLKVPLRSINYKHYKWYIESDQIIPLRFVVNFVGIRKGKFVSDRTCACPTGCIYISLLLIRSSTYKRWRITLSGYLWFTSAGRSPEPES